MIATNPLNALPWGTDQSAPARAAESSLPTIQRVESRHHDIRGKLAAARDSNIPKPERGHDVRN